MPKLYEYFGLIIMFYSNDHEPVHVHGRKGGKESKAEIKVIDGKEYILKFKDVKGKPPLDATDFKNFKKLVEEYAKDIVEKWIEFFVLGKRVNSKKINKKI